MEKEIIYILEKIRPYIQNDGGDIEFVKFENGIVYVRMHGACVGCMELDTTHAPCIRTYTIPFSNLTNSISPPSFWI